MARLPSLCRLSLRNLYQPVATQSSKRCLPSLSSSKVLKNETEHSLPSSSFLQNTFSTNICGARGFASKSKLTQCFSNKFNNERKPIIQYNIP